MLPLERMDAGALPESAATLHPREDGTWVVRVLGMQGKKPQEYTCFSRDQAERLAALFAQPPQPARRSGSARPPALPTHPEAPARTMPPVRTPATAAPPKERPRGVLQVPTWAWGRR